MLVVCVIAGVCSGVGIGMTVFLWLALLFVLRLGFLLVVCLPLCLYW